MKAADWIDRVKLARGWESDYRVAKEIGLTKQVVSAYRNRPEMTMDEDTAIKVALALDEKPEVILIDQALERARSDTAKTALQRVLTRLGVKPRPLGGAGGAEVSAGQPAADVDITKSTSIRAGKRRKTGQGPDGLYIVSSGTPVWWRAIAAAIFPGAGDQFGRPAV